MKAKRLATGNEHFYEIVFVPMGISYEEYLQDMSSCDQYSIVIIGNEKPTLEEAKVFLYEDIRKDCMLRNGWHIVDVIDWGWLGDDAVYDDVAASFDVENIERWPVFSREGLLQQRAMQMMQALAAGC